MSEFDSPSLAARREVLRLRSTQLREDIAERSRVFRPVFRITDRVLDGVRAVEHPSRKQAFAMLAAAALAGAVLVRPRIAVGLGLRALSAWQAYRRLQPLVRTVLRQIG